MCVCLCVCVRGCVSTCCFCVWFCCSRRSEPSQMVQAATVPGQWGWQRRPWSRSTRTAQMDTSWASTDCTTSHTLLTRWGPSLGGSNRWSTRKKMFLRAYFIQSNSICFTKNYEKQFNLIVKTPLSGESCCLKEVKMYCSKNEDLVSNTYYRSLVTAVCLSVCLSRKRMCYTTKWLLM